MDANNHRLTYEYGGFSIIRTYSNVSLEQMQWLNGVSLHHEVLDIMLREFKSEPMVEEAVEPLKPKTVELTISEYEQLLSDSQWLSYLEAAGVDNWQGFDEARKMMEDEITEN